MAGSRPAERPAALRRLPVPWNAELVFYLLLELVVAVICLAYDTVNTVDFLAFTKWTSAAYLLARGIAKASRVLNDD